MIPKYEIDVRDLCEKMSGVYTKPYTKCAYPIVLCASASPWPCRGFSLRLALLRTELGILFRQLVDQGGVALARTRSSTAKEPAFYLITSYNLFEFVHELL